MAKQSEDKKTPDLLPSEIAPVPARRGRKPQGDQAMTPAQRMAAMRARKKSISVEFSYSEFLVLYNAVCAWQSSCSDQTHPEFKRMDQMRLKILRKLHP